LNSTSEQLSFDLEDKEPIPFEFVPPEDWLYFLFCDAVKEV
jgi:hypothetical protein|tara:strand:- start:1063 stop:1185 length:123 start_codon:yes stop_codon:yes gene_type:complete